MKETVLRHARKKEIRHQVVEGKKNLLCGKCKAYACSTDDIRVIKVCVYMETYIHEHQEIALFVSVEHSCKLEQKEILSKAVNHRTSHNCFHTVLRYLKRISLRYSILCCWLLINTCPNRSKSSEKSSKTGFA